MRYIVLSSCLLWGVACSRNSSEPDLHSHEAPGTAAKAAAPSKAQPHPPTSAPPAPAGLGPEQAGGLRFHAEAPLVRRPPSSSMRVAEYVLPEAPDQPLTVFYFPGQGGSVDANVTRWLGQFTQPDGSSTRDEAEIVRSKVEGVPVTRVEVEGRYGGGMAMPKGKAPESIAEAKLLGAIAEGPEGPLFFKWVGPEELLEEHEPAFDALLSSIEPL